MHIRWVVASRLNGSFISEIAISLSAPSPASIPYVILTNRSPRQMTTPYHKVIFRLGRPQRSGLSGGSLRRAAINSLYLYRERSSSVDTVDSSSRSGAVRRFYMLRHDTIIIIAITIIIHVIVKTRFYHKTFSYEPPLTYLAALIA